MSDTNEKRIFQISAGVLVLGTVFGAGLYSGGTQNAVYKAAQGAAGSVRTVFEERETLTAAEPVHFLQPARYEGAGVTINEIDDGSVVLISGFFDGNPGLRLMARDGTVLRQWETPHSQFFPDTSFLYAPPATDWNMDIHGQTLLPDGSVVFNFEYGGTVKMGRCGDVAWTLEHPTHHSLDQAEAGGFWILGRDVYDQRTDPRYPPFSILRHTEQQYDDLILRVRDDGTIEAQKSIPEILYENGYEAVLTATGENFKRFKEEGPEIVHSNKVGELSSELAPAFPDFEAGDLAISLRGYNTVFVVDPDTWEVKWLHTGPWIRQHDPEFQSDGTIAIFNNNTYFHVMGRLMKAKPDAPKVSNIIVIDPKTNESRVAYGQRPGQEFVTTVRGKQDPTPGGGFLISPHEEGRVFEVDASGRMIWQFINRYDATQVAEIIEGQAYPASYFTVSDWSCP